MFFLYFFQSKNKKQTTINFWKLLRIRWSSICIYSWQEFRIAIISLNFIFIKSNWPTNFEYFSELKENSLVICYFISFVEFGNSAATCWLHLISQGCRSRVDRGACPQILAGSVNPISGGTFYAHHIITCPPSLFLDFSYGPEPKQYQNISRVWELRKSYVFSKYVRSSRKGLLCLSQLHR